MLINFVCHFLFWQEVLNPVIVQKLFQQIAEAVSDFIATLQNF